jgi:hypothetical protein
MVELTKVSFRRATWDSIFKKDILPATVWIGLGLFAYLAWSLGPRSTVGPVLACAVFPLLAVAARLMNGRRWRLVLQKWLPVYALSCTRALFLESFTFYGSSGDGSAIDHFQKLMDVLERIAGFLIQNSFCTAVVLLTLLSSFRFGGSTSERRSFLVCTVVIWMSMVSIGVVCACDFHAVMTLITLFHAT